MIWNMPRESAVTDWLGSPFCLCWVMPNWKCRFTFYAFATEVQCLRLPSGVTPRQKCKCRFHFFFLHGPSPSDATITSYPHTTGRSTQGPCDSLRFIDPRDGDYVCRKVGSRYCCTWHAPKADSTGNVKLCEYGGIKGSLLYAANEND